MTCAALHHEILTALQWYSDHGVDIVVEDDAVDRYAQYEQDVQNALRPQPMASAAVLQEPPATGGKTAPAFLGKSDAVQEAVKVAKSVATLEDLQKAIAAFEGIALKKTASNLVFSDGNPKAKIMMIGDAPGTDEDRQGKAFVGPEGALLDRILSSIGLARMHEDVERSVYLTHLVNWRPPGNRTVSPAEVAVSLPFLERHIQLIKPEILIFFGGVSAQALLGQTQSISRLRKKWHNYSCQTADLKGGQAEIPALVTYHPAYLLTTPIQKKSVWMDILMLKAKLED